MPRYRPVIEHIADEQRSSWYIVDADGNWVSGECSVEISLADFGALPLTNKEMKIRIDYRKNGATCAWEKRAVLGTEWEPSGPPP
jgi:hypothetical protein